MSAGRQTGRDTGVSAGPSPGGIPRVQPGPKTGSHLFYLKVLKRTDHSDHIFIFDLTESKV